MHLARRLPPDEPTSHIALITSIPMLRSDKYCTVSVARIQTSSSVKKIVHSFAVSPTTLLRDGRKVDSFRTGMFVRDTGLRSELSSSLSSSLLNS